MAPIVRRPLDLATEYARRFNRGDLDGLTELYEPHAILLAENGTVLRQQGLRAEHQRNIASGIPIQITGQRIVTDPNLKLALLLTQWTMRGLDPQGNYVCLSGESTDIARPTESGAWLYALDNPMGTQL